MIMDNARIKENIIRKRKEKGISQDEMARRLDMSRNSYRSIEKGSTNVVSKRLGEIAGLLDVSEEELVLGYKPLDGTGELEDIRTQYAMSCKSLKDEYETRISELNAKIATMQETIANLNEIISSKNEIIALLKRNNT